MADHASRRFYVADLVVAAIVCGLAAAGFQTYRRSSSGIVLFSLALVLPFGWGAVRSLRKAPACAECGRRFTPTRQTAPAIQCPHCGEPQAGLARKSKRSEKILSAVAISAASSLVVTFALILGGPPADGRMIGSLIAIGCAVASASGFGAIAVVAYRSRKQRPCKRPCEACGGDIPAPSESRICPLCRHRHLSVEAARKEHDRGVWVLLVVAGVVAGLAAIGVAGNVRPIVDTGDRMRLSLVALAAIGILFLAWKFLRLIIFLFRFRTLARESATWDKARRCAGEDGTIVHDGSITAWYSGPLNPVPMLREQFAASRRRFEPFLGGTAGVDPPIRVVGFHDRDALARFHASVFPGFAFADQLGLYVQRPWGVLTICTTEVPGRVGGPETVAAALYDQVLLEHVHGILPALWLAVGVLKALAADGQRGASARLNRKMLASFARQSEWADELFSTSGTAFSRLMRRSTQTKPHQKWEQSLHQSWSIVEYLSGGGAPGSRRAAFLAFLKDRRAAQRQEETFFEHFGFGFGSLLDGWRQWVTEQGIGAHEPPPRPIRDALLDRVLPVIRDRRAKRWDRILAIRDWAVAGFALGAVAPIELLRQPGEIPKEEITWALEMVSGLALGDDPDRWQGWWESLPATVTATDPRSGGADAEPIPTTPGGAATAVAAD